MIFEIAMLKRRRKTVASASQACKAWSSVAIGLLWKRIELDAFNILAPVLPLEPPLGQLYVVCFPHCSTKTVFMILLGRRCSKALLLRTGIPSAASPEELLQSTYRRGTEQAPTVLTSSSAKKSQPTIRIAKSSPIFGSSRPASDHSSPPSCQSPSRPSLSTSDVTPTIRSR